MQEQSIWRYIWFGTVLRFLQDASPGEVVAEDGRALQNLQWFLDRLPKLGLTITANAARISHLPEILKELEGLDDEAQMDSDRAAKLRDAVTRVRLTLQAEAAEKKAFVTSPKRWDVDRLLTDPAAMFAADVYDALGSQAAFDFGEACKCLAFERPTAAAFHTMRGTEAVLRDFYCHVVRQKRLPPEQRMWGSMVKKLEERSAPPPKELLDTLDAIRRNFRNPTQHPDAIYSLDQAQDLFGVAAFAVNQMVGLMRQ